MNRPLLNNEDQYPDDKVLEKHLKDNYKIWNTFIENITGKYDQINLEWKYYKDGKSWLCKAVKKKKTICWVSIWDGFFKTTFYFTEKLDEKINNLNISQTLKENYQNNKNIGKLKPLIIEVKDEEILKDLFILFEFKIKIK